MYRLYLNEAIASGSMLVPVANWSRVVADMLTVDPLVSKVPVVHPVPRPFVAGVVPSVV